MKRFKYAEQKIYCNCIEVYQIYEDDDYNKIFEVLSKLGNKNFKKKQLLSQSKNLNKCYKILTSNKITIQGQQQVYIRVDMII